MSRHYFAKAGAIGTVSLGLLAASLGAGCGSSPDGSAGNGTPEKAGITQEGQFAVGGCGATGTFLITAPQFINWIAVNANSVANNSVQQSLLNNMQMTLQAVTAQNQTVQVNQQFQHADSLLQSAINTANTVFNLNQTAFSNATMQSATQQVANANNIYEAANASQVNSGFASTNTNQFNTAYQASSANQLSNVHTDAFQNANAWNSANQFANGAAGNQAFAANTANAAQTANAANSANAANTANNFANNNAFGNTGTNAFTNSLVPIAAGAIGAFPLFNNTLANTFFNNGAATAAGANNATTANNFSNVNNAQMANNLTNAANNSFFNNASGVFNQSHVNNNTAANTFAQNHTDAQNVVTNTNHLDTTTAYNNASAVNSSRVLNQNSLASNFTAANAAANGFTSALNQAANTSLANQSTITSTNSNALVYANLSSLQANQFILNTNLTTNQLNSLMQIYTGNNTNSVSQAAAFPIATPGCF
jgi:hypothetical protein